jgi:hypothetical protein
LGKVARHIERRDEVQLAISHGWRP